MEGLNLPCGVRVLRQMCPVPSLLSLDLLGSISCLWREEADIRGGITGAPSLGRAGLTFFGPDP